MRTLKYYQPSKVTSTRISRIDFIDNPTELHIAKSLCVDTKYGIVNVYDCYWTVNTGVHSFTHFYTIINGIRYMADLEESKLSERCIKWMATHFIKKIIHNN